MLRVEYAHACAGHTVWVSHPFSAEGTHIELTHHDRGKSQSAHLFQALNYRQDHPASNRLGRHPALCGLPDQVGGVLHDVLCTIQPQQPLIHLKERAHNLVLMLMYVQN